MTQLTPASKTNSAPSTGRIVIGVTFIVVWLLVHVALFYLFLTSGMLTDLLLYFARMIMFPGGAQQPDGTQLFNWGGTLQAGLIVAGAAGIPAGLAIFWRSRRKMLLWMFAGALLAGLLIEIYAVYTLFANAFSGIG